MPLNHQQYLQWNGDRFRSWAAKIGANTAAIIEVFLTTHKVEQQGYKACMALLKLSDKYTSKRLEAACTKALSYTPRPNYKSISVILSSGQDRHPEPQQPSAPSEFGFVRGADYYKGHGGTDDAE